MDLLMRVSGYLKSDNIFNLIESSINNKNKIIKASVLKLLLIFSEEVGIQVINRVLERVPRNTQLSVTVRVHLTLGQERNHQGFGHVHMQIHKVAGNEESDAEHSQQYVRVDHCSSLTALHYPIGYHSGRQSNYEAGGQ